MCDQYSMEYISELLKHFSKIVIQCVQNCSNIPGYKGIGYMFETNCSSLHQLLVNKVAFITNKIDLFLNNSNFRQ